MTPIELGKTLCFLLRHKPEALNLNVDEIGFVAIDEIIEGFTGQGKDVSLESILEAVREDDKGRFALSADNSKIRAVQGHSFPVSEEAYVQAEPPELLYHGTVTGNLEAIFKEGLKPGSRNFVHLTDHIETAKLVGSRYRKKGEVVILAVAVEKIADDSLPFYQALNGVWLIKSVNPEALTVIK